MMTTTLELPRSLRFTVDSNPQPYIVPSRRLERLDQITARNHVAYAVYALFAAGLVGLALVFLLGIAGR